MKKIRIPALLLLISIFYYANAYGQQTKSIMHLLIQNEWLTSIKMNEDQYIKTSNIFTPTEFIQKTKIQGQTEFEVKFQYYLSDSIETTFDYKKVGKALNGSYIITINKNSKICIMRIVKISNSELEFEFIKNDRILTKSTKSNNIVTCQAKSKL